MAREKYPGPPQFNGKMRHLSGEGIQFLCHLCHLLSSLHRQKKRLVPPQFKGKMRPSIPPLAFSISVDTISGDPTISPAGFTCLSCMQKPKYGTKKYLVGPQFRSKMRPNAVSHLSRGHSVSQPRKAEVRQSHPPRVEVSLSTDRRAAPRRRNDFSAEARWTVGRPV